MRERKGTTNFISFILHHHMCRLQRMCEGGGRLDAGDYIRCRTINVYPALSPVPNGAAIRSFRPGATHRARVWGTKRPRQRLCRRQAQTSRPYWHVLVKRNRKSRPRTGG